MYPGPPSSANMSTEICNVQRDGMSMFCSGAFDRAWTYSCDEYQRCARVALEGEAAATGMSETQCKMECKPEGRRRGLLSSRRA